MRNRGSSIGGILQAEIFEALDGEQGVVGICLQVTQLDLDGIVRFSKL